MNKFKLILSIIWEEGILPMLAYSTMILLLFGIPFGIVVSVLVFLDYLFGDKVLYIIGEILILTLIMSIISYIILVIIDWIRRVLIPKYREKLRK